MHFQDCFTGQRVVHKESGKLATIRKVHSNGEVELTFDAGATAHVHARVLEPLAKAVAAVAKPDGPMRPCPQCATKMPVSETKCPSCGFEYGVKKSSGSSGIGKFLIVVIVLAGIGYAVWKFVLHEKLPW
jgi:hypothetical protein